MVLLNTSEEIYVSEIYISTKNNYKKWLDKCVIVISSPKIWGTCPVFPSLPQACLCNISVWYQGGGNNTSLVVQHVLVASTDLYV